MASISYLFLIGLVYFQASMQGSSGFVDEEIPKKCVELGYCEESASHPTEVAEKLVRELVEAGVPLDSDANMIPENNLGEATCSHTTQIITPFIIQDVIDGEWYYVLNTKKYSIQKYLVQICAEPTSGESAQECSRQVIFQNDYGSRCVQKYITRTITGMRNSTPYPILARLPCCCSCVAIKTSQ